MTQRNQGASVLSGENRALSSRKHRPPSKLQLWSAAVKARDGRCMCCGSTDDLHAHHIQSKAERPDLALNVENGKTLCYRCHKAEHERNRVRVRQSHRPQRRTLAKQIELLESEVRRLTGENKRLAQLVGECRRGSCATKLKPLQEQPCH